VLPQWTDCYDFAERVEMLGIGKVGNKSTKPVWTAKELSQVVIEVTLSSKSHAYKQKAKELAQVCQDKGDGAVNAAKFLMQEINVSG
jgi:UDP:flavonoid glycosyltransferase YjiC (YdhE family)